LQGDILKGREAERIRDAQAEAEFKRAKEAQDGATAERIVGVLDKAIGTIADPISKAFADRMRSGPPFVPGPARPQPAQPAAAPNPQAPPTAAQVRDQLQRLAQHEQSVSEAKARLLDELAFLEAAQAQAPPSDETLSRVRRSTRPSSLRAARAAFSRRDPSASRRRGSWTRRIRRRGTRRTGQRSRRRTSRSCRRGRRWPTSRARRSWATSSFGPESGRPSMRASISCPRDCTPLRSLPGASENDRSAQRTS